MKNRSLVFFISLTAWLFPFFFFVFASPLVCFNEWIEKQLSSGSSGFFIITYKDGNLLYKTNDYLKADEMSMFLSN